MKVKIMLLELLNPQISRWRQCHYKSNRLSYDTEKVREILGRVARQCAPIAEVNEAFQPGLNRRF